MYKEEREYPSVDNPWFVHQSYGGKSLAVAINESNGYVLPNCVGCANGLENVDIINIMGNEKYCRNDIIYDGEQVYDHCVSIGRLHGHKPKLCGTMCWRCGVVGNEYDGRGHVAHVLKVIDDDHIIIGHSGDDFEYVIEELNSDNNWGIFNDNYKYQGCIYLPQNVQDELERQLNPKPIEPVEPKPEPKPVEPTNPYPNRSDEDLADGVWHKEFGDGKAREDALGIRYDMVQSLVEHGVGKFRVGEKAIVRSAWDYNNFLNDDWVVGYTFLVSEVDGDRVVLVKTMNQENPTGVWDANNLDRVD